MTLRTRREVLVLVCGGLSLSTLAGMLSACTTPAPTPAATTAPATTSAPKPTTAASPAAAPVTSPSAAAAAPSPSAATAAAPSPSAATAAASPSPVAALLGPPPGAKRGGTVTVSIAQSPSTLDPAFGINAGEFIMTSWLYDNLVSLSPDLTLHPMLATDWSSTPDAKTFTFKLRQGVKFTTGRELTADDVVYSISRILDPQTASPGRTALGPIDHVEAVDPYTIRFTLSSAYVDLPYALTDRWGRILPRDHTSDEFKTQAFGSGPFKLKEYLPGVQVSVERNPDHWQENTPLLDGAILKTYPDTVAEITALGNDETQIMWQISPSSYDQVASASNTKIYEVPTGNWLPMIMRVDQPPFDKNEVREAVKYCVDRDAFVKTVVRGHGTPANDTNIPPNSPAYLKTSVRQQDYAKAKQLLAQAGLPNGFTQDVVAATDNPLRADTAVAIQQMLQPAGIMLNVKTIDYPTYIANIYRKAPCYIGSWAMRPVLDLQLSPFFSTGGSSNEYAYSNPQLDDLLTRARSTTDANQRNSLYQDVQRLLSSEGPALIPYLVDYITAASTKLSNFQAHPMTWLDLRYVYFG
jgi:peptide/nickel transport system substrate-binding protein